ncbi:GNAT family N-acetyltransferase [Roseomonas arctica]|uniref:GNAT family N-acetyltransferase n=2 Tax=Plastoroseomonas arctica TaxID=1509237 RepID=A0AAF1KRI8_9PROT|nr:GNAT family N-acetyltransferase [Plastoroseomonas arctica]
MAREDDARALASMMSARISARLATWPELMTPSMARNRLARDLADAQRIAPMVMELREDGAVCGWMSVTRLPEHPACGILTYWLGEAHQGRGLMREAAPQAVRHLFEKLGLERLRAAVQMDNAASIGVLHAAGMRPLGPGRIWCSARGQEETCLWFEIDRAMALGEAVGIGHSEAAGESPDAVASEHWAGVPER